MKRRALVLTNDIARHPFRASLPPHVCTALPPSPVQSSGWRDFLSAYSACFAAVLTFVA